jgi:hypothetical protein
MLCLVAEAEAEAEAEGAAAAAGAIALPNHVRPHSTLCTFVFSLVCGCVLQRKRRSQSMTMEWMVW